MVDHERTAVDVSGDASRLAALTSRVQVTAALAILGNVGFVLFNVWAIWLPNDDPVMQTYRQWRMAIMGVDVVLWYLVWWHINAWIREKGDLESGGRISRELLARIIGARGMQRWNVLWGSTISGLVAAFAAVPLALNVTTVIWGHALGAISGLCLVIGMGAVVVLVRESSSRG